MASEEEALRRYEDGFKPEVLWFFGETGTGKTRSAKEMCDPKHTYVVARNRKGNTPWFNGYNPIIHENVIFDDFRWDWFDFDTLLRLLDYSFMQ